jgi:hypothetical protein
MRKYFPIQGSAADIIKIAGINIHKKKLKSEIGRSKMLFASSQSYLMYTNDELRKMAYD